MNTLTLTELDEMLTHDAACQASAGGHRYIEQGRQIRLECSRTVTHRLSLSCRPPSNLVCATIVQIYRFVVGVNGVCYHCRADLQDCWRLMPV